MLQPMKAITVWNPWAYLLAILAKLYETRSWATNYRGQIAIHAAAMSPHNALAGVGFDVIEAMRLALDMERQSTLYGTVCQMEDLPRSSIIATADLIGCHKIGTVMGEAVIWRTDTEFEVISDREFLLGNFTPGRFAWEFANMQLLAEPIPTKGRQGLWNWGGVA